MEAVSNGTLADEFMLDFEDGEPAVEEEHNEEEDAAMVGEFSTLTTLPPSLRTTPRFLSVMQEMDACGEDVTGGRLFGMIAKANELAADVAEHQLRTAKYTK